ncbi:hypothetical protein ACA910_006738 [Epithemia clementina (nom. ined.)]
MTTSISRQIISCGRTAALWSQNQQVNRRKLIDGGLCRARHRHFGRSKLIVENAAKSLTASSGLWSSSLTRPFSTKSSSSSSGMEIKWWHPVLGGLVITTAGALKWFHDHLGGMEGLQRSVSFYSKAIPKYILYRYHMWAGSPDEVWDELDKETSKVALEKILELEGFYYKAGQMCASNLGDAFPEIWRDTMSVLQDQVPPQPFDTVKQIMQSEIPDLDQKFLSIEEKPIGSASIGQVHRAVLRDGRKVVVKVCYPNAERLLRGDVRTIKAFASLAQPVHVPALAEIEKQFQTEFDYQQEAQNMATVRKNLTKAGLCGPGKLCQIPEPYPEHCTKRVLVMEELFGDKLEVALKRDVQFHAQRANQSVEEFLLAQKEDAEQKIRKGEKVQGPSAKEFDLLISMEDGKRKMKNAWNRLYNIVTATWLRGGPGLSYEDKTVLPLNHAKLVDDLISIHGHEVLVDGFFNGDCHPGNVLLCREANGSPQLGLIDYGQVKSLTKEQRHLFAKLIIALDENNNDEICGLIQEAGYKSKKMDPEVMVLYAKAAFDDDSRAITGGLHIQLFMEKIQETDPIISLPTMFVMVSRCSLLLRGLAHALKQSRTIAHAWRPIAERVLKEDI